MATTPQGDDPDVRHSVMEAMARAVARQRMVTPKKRNQLSAVYSKATAPRPVMR